MVQYSVTRAWLQLMVSEVKLLCLAHMKYDQVLCGLQKNNNH